MSYNDKYMEFEMNERYLDNDTNNGPLTDTNEDINGEILLGVVQSLNSVENAESKLTSSLLESGTVLNLDDDMKSSQFLIPPAPNSVIPAGSHTGGQIAGGINHDDLGQDFSLFTNFLNRYRRIIALCAPMLFFEINWWILAFRLDFFQYFPARYEMSIVMIFGALIAGMTSEGGGAIAFPAMTLALKISPAVARDFSLMIQSCGMTAAAFSIYMMKVQLEWRSVYLCSFSAIFGLVFGCEFVDKHLTSAQKKMIFVSVWFSFAIALFILNLQKNRKTFNFIPDFNWWKAGTLLGAGFMGGIFTGVAGSGVDICSFSILTLLFHVNEKVATPTSVVLMAVNTVVGFYWRNIVMNDIEEVTWEYLAVCVPIVVIFAPIGSLLATYFHRLVLASLIYILETVALISAFAIIKPDLTLSLISVGILVGGFSFFFSMSRFGKRLAKQYEEKTDLARNVQVKPFDAQNGISHKEDTQFQQTPVEIVMPE